MFCVPLHWYTSTEGMRVVSIEGCFDRRSFRSKQFRDRRVNDDKNCFSMRCGLIVRVICETRNFGSGFQLMISFVVGVRDRMLDANELCDSHRKFVSSFFDSFHPEVEVKVTYF